MCIRDRTYAVRDTVIDDKEIKQGDYMGIGDKSILAVGKDIKSTTEDMVAEMVDEESAIICISVSYTHLYAGKPIEPAAKRGIGSIRRSVVETL